MSLKTFISLIRASWRVIAVAAASGLVLGFIAFLLLPTKYTSQVTLYVAARSADNTASAYQGNLLSQQRVTSYVELVSSPRVAETVVSSLRLPDDPVDLAREITAESAPDSILINVAVKDSSQQRATAIAASVSAEMSRLVGDLERPNALNGVPAVSLREVQPATVPDRPSSLGLAALALLGAIAGAAAGVVIVIVRNTLDSTIRSGQSLEELTGSSYMGSIYRDDTASNLKLRESDPDQSHLIAESTRKVRTSLQFLAVDNPPKVIAVSSSSEGEGKSTTLANLAIVLAQAGSNVLVIEADMRRPTLSKLFETEAEVGLSTVLSGRIDYHDAIQSAGDTRVKVITSGQLPPNPSELLGSNTMRNLVSSLRADFDYVLIDTPPMLPVADPLALAPIVDGMIVVCRYGKTTERSIRTALSNIAAANMRVLGTVLSMAPEPSKSGRYYQYSAYYSSREEVLTPDATTVNLKSDASRQTSTRHSKA